MRNRSFSLRNRSNSPCSGKFKVPAFVGMLFAEPRSALEHRPIALNEMPNYPPPVDGYNLFL
jgi:hypothetical protein